MFKSLIHKSLVVIACLIVLCAFAIAQHVPAEQSTQHERVRRQMPMPGDMMNIPLQAGWGMAETAAGIGKKMVSPGAPGMGGGMPGMDPMSGK